MIKVNLNDKVINKHIKYIVYESKIYDSISNFKTFKFFEKKYLNVILAHNVKTKPYVDELLGVSKTKEKLIDDLNNEHVKFMEFIQKNIEELRAFIELKKQLDRENNIFVAEPKQLNEIIKQIKSNYKKISIVFMIEKHLNFDNKYSGKVIEVIGYKAFSKKPLINFIKKYENFLKNIISKNMYNKFYDECSAAKMQVKGQTHREEVLKEIRDKIIEKIEAFKCSSIVVNDIEKSILTKIIEVIEKKELTNVKGKSIGRDNFIKLLQSIINPVIDGLDTLNPGYMINIDNLKDYSKMFDTKWSAYKYVMELGLEVCPYCNRQYITPLYCDGGQVRADLDHFYPKYIYPYLSMSIYNLVPSCKFCNSSLKNDADFEYENNLNPFEYGFSNLYTFSYDIIDENGVINKENVKIIMKDNSKNKEEEEIVKKAKNNCSIFQIENIYNFHKQDVCDLIKKKVIYTKKNIEVLLKEHDGLFDSQEQLLDFLMGDYSRDGTLSKKILSKLIKDIRDELDKTNIIIDGNQLKILCDFLKKK